MLRISQTIRIPQASVLHDLGEWKLYPEGDGVRAYGTLAIILSSSPLDSPILLSRWQDLGQRFSTSVYRRATPGVSSNANSWTLALESLILWSLGLEISNRLCGDGT